MMCAQVEMLAHDIGAAAARPGLKAAMLGAASVGAGGLALLAHWA